jgi:hypothetical protein
MAQPIARHRLLQQYDEHAKLGSTGVATKRAHTEL